MSNANFLYKIADVLEAVADEKSKLAAELDTYRVGERRRKLEPLVDKLSYVTDDTAGLEAKLSSLDPDTIDLLSKVAGEDAPQLGGSYKYAGLATTTRADDDFGSWILS